MALEFLKFWRKKDYGTIINGLARIVGSEWGDEKYLRAYEKSLYVFACVSKIAEEIGNANLRLFQIVNSKGDTKEVMVHPALDLIYRVNPFQTKSEFFEITVINLKLVGEAFWFKVRNEQGQVVELWNLRPDYMTIVKDEETFIKGYEFRKEDGAVVKFAPEDIVHHKYPSPLDAYRGTSPLRAAAIRVDIEEYASTYQRDFFLNNARPDAVLQFEGNITPEQKDEIREGWNTRYQGKGKNSKIGILEGGVKYQQLSITQREMDYIESLKLTRDDILVVFKTPKPIVAITDDVNRANAEAAKEVFMSNTIKPELRRLVEKMNEMLIITDFDDALFLDFDDPTPENVELKLKQYESGLKNGYILINEVRQEIGREPVDGGDVPLLAAGTQTLDQVINGPLQNGQQQAGAPFQLAHKSYSERMNNHRLVLQQNKQAIFKGRYMLFKKFEIAEYITKEMTKNAAAAAKRVAKSKKTKGKKTIQAIPSPEDKSKFRSLIGDTVVKKIYAEIVVKKLDAKEAKFRKRANAEAEQQRERFIKLLNSGKIDKALTPDEKDLAKLIGVSMQTMEKWTKSEHKHMAEFVFDELETIVKAAGKEAMALVDPNKDFNYNKAVKQALKNRAEEFAESVNGTTLTKLTNTISEGIAAGEGIDAITTRVNSVYTEFSDYRSERIARTETTAANNKGFEEAFRQSDTATHKEWIATNDSRTREEHVSLDGDIVPIGETFSNGLQYPQEPNCRCVIGPAFVDA